MGAAELDHPQARHLREQQRSGALQRWLLPHLMAAALRAGAGAAANAASHVGGKAGGQAGDKGAKAGSGGGAAAGAAETAAAGGEGGSTGGSLSQGTAFGQLLDLYASALGVGTPSSPGCLTSSSSPAKGSSGSSSSPSIEAALEGSFCGAGAADGSSCTAGSCSFPPASQQLQLVDLATFYAADPAAQLVDLLHRHLQHPPAAPTDATAAAGAAGVGAVGLEELGVSVQRRARLWVAALGALQRQVEGRLRGEACCCGLVTGDVLSLAVLLVDESCLWAVTCLEVGVAVAPG